MGWIRPTATLKELMRLTEISLAVSFWFFTVILVIGLFGCAQIPIPDETIYGVRYPPGNGAVSVHTITGPIVDLSESDWLTMQATINAENEAVMCMSSASFADFKSEIEQLCSLGNYCTYPETQSVQQFFLKMNNLKKQLGKRK